MFSFIVVLIVVGCAFGAPQIDGRIVGGVDADIKDIPYQVSLQLDSSHICGGSIINENTILTTVNCVDDNWGNPPPERYQIRVGSSLKSSGGQLYYVSKFILHPNHTKYSWDYNVALVKLSSNIVFGVGVNSIPLPSAELNIPVGTQITVSGWGSAGSASGGLNPEKLQVATISVVDREVCADLLFPYLPVSKMHFCAGDGNSHGSCDRDNGGPVVYNGQVIGMFLGNRGCIGVDPKYPGVYTRVSDFVTWINQQL